MARLVPANPWWYDGHVQRFRGIPDIIYVELDLVPYILDRNSDIVYRLTVDGPERIEAPAAYYDMLFSEPRITADEAYRLAQNIDDNKKEQTVIVTETESDQRHYQQKKKSVATFLFIVCVPIIISISILFISFQFDFELRLFITTTTALIAFLIIPLKLLIGLYLDWRNRKVISSTAYCSIEQRAVAVVYALILTSLTLVLLFNLCLAFAFDFWNRNLERILIIEAPISLLFVYLTRKWIRRIFNRLLDSIT